MLMLLLLYVCGRYRRVKARNNVDSARKNSIEHQQPLNYTILYYTMLAGTGSDE